MCFAVRVCVLIGWLWCRLLPQCLYLTLYICPPYLYTVATLPWEIQKSFFNSISHTFFRLFMLSEKKKQTVIPLPTTP